MQTDIVYGYGFEFDIADAETFLAFLKKHESVIPQIACNSSAFITNFEKNMDNPEAGLEEIDDICYVLYGEYAGYWVAQIIAAETGIRFDYQQASEYYSAKLMLAETYPWRMNEAEKNLTEESCQEILEKYQEELGIKTSIDYDRVEYFG